MNLTSVASTILDLSTIAFEAYDYEVNNPTTKLGFSKITNLGYTVSKLVVCEKHGGCRFDIGTLKILELASCHKPFFLGTKRGRDAEYIKEYG